MAKNAIAPWKHKKLADVAQVQTGIAKNKEQVLVDPVEIPYLRVANVQDGHLDLSEIKTIAVESSRVDRYALEDGDVLMTEGGDFDKLGRGAVWRNQITPCLHQNHVFAVRVNRKHLLPEFLAAYCAAAPGRRYFLACSKQTTNLASINSSQLKELPLQLPSLDEQRRIVRVLDAAKRLENVSDDLYRKRRALAAAKFVEVAKAAGWDSVRLSDIVSINADSLPDSTDPDREIQYFDVSSDGDHEVSGRMRFSQAPSRARRLAEAGDVVYATIRPLLRRLFIAEDRPDAVYSTGYAILSGPEDVTRYLYHALTTEPVERQIHAFSTGTGYPAISAGDLGDVKIRLPNKASRIAIANMADAMLKHADAHRQIAEVAGLRHRGLMQILLTGQKRLTCDLPGMAVTDG